MQLLQKSEKIEKLLLQSRNFVNFLTTDHEIWYNKRIGRKISFLFFRRTSGRTAGNKHKNRKDLMNMGLTLTEKILKAHLVEGEMKKGTEIGIRIDQTLTQDATGTMAYLEFEAMGVPRVRTERSVAYIDHNTLQSGFELWQQNYSCNLKSHFTKKFCQGIFINLLKLN